MRPILFYLFFYIAAMGAANAQEFEPDELIIDSIECVGNAATDCEIIKSEIYLNPGERVNEEELRNSKIRLQLLGLFKEIDLTLKKGAEPGHVVLTVAVVEDSPYFSETNITNRYGNFSGFTLGLSYKIGHRNVFGKGKILQGSIYPIGLFDSDNETYSGGIEYIDPHLFGHKKYYFSTGISHFFVNDVEESDYLATTKNSTTYKLNVGRRIFDFSHIAVGVINRQSTVLRRDQKTDPFKETNDHGTSYTLNYGWNSEDDTYFPTEGSLFETTYYRSEYGGGGSANTSFKQNWLVSSKNIIALHLDDTFIPDFNNYHDVGLGLEWAHQQRRNQTGSNITDARFYLMPKVSYNSNSDYWNESAEFGYVMDTKNLGVIKLTAFLDWTL